MNAPQRPWGRAIAKWLFLAVALSSLALCGLVIRGADVHHHVEVRNATDVPLGGFRLAFDNAPFKLDAPPIPPHRTYVFDLVRAAETGYVFSIPDGNDRLELGRCGYTKSVGIVRLSSKNRA